MARRPITRRRIQALADRLEPVAREAFLEAIADITDRADLGAIIAMLERGDIGGAIRAVHLDPAAFRALENALIQAYGAGGAATLSGLPALRDPMGNRLVVRFDQRAPRAERYLRTYTARLVTGITDDTRVLLRNAMTAGLEAGRNPRSIALDLVGRIDRSSNRRTGGLIGLTSTQERTVERARAALLSGDREGMLAYRRYKTRDRRFDASVDRALRDGVGLDRGRVDRIIGRLNDNNLRLRGETVARTEVMTALHASKDEAFRQVVDTGAVAAGQVQKVWIATKDDRTRDSHRAIDGERVGLDEKFSNGLRFPHEPGAPAGELINCRCDYTHVIDFLAGLD